MRMSKETIIAIIFGVGFGALVGVFVLFQTKGGEETKVIPVGVEQDQKKVNPDKPPSDKTMKILAISSPVGAPMVTENTIKIEGTVEKDSLIIIQSAVAEDIQKNKTETFSAEIPLAVGENVIQVSAYSDSTTPQEQTIHVYYLPE